MKKTKLQGDNFLKDELKSYKDYLMKHSRTMGDKALLRAIKKAKRREGKNSMEVEDALS